MLGSENSTVVVCCNVNCPSETHKFVCCVNKEAKIINHSISAVDSIPKSLMRYMINVMVVVGFKALKCM